MILLELINGDQVSLNLKLWQINNHKYTRNVQLDSIISIQTWLLLYFVLTYCKIHLYPPKITDIIASIGHGRRTKITRWLIIIK